MKFVLLIAFLAVSSDAGPLSRSTDVLQDVKIVTLNKPEEAPEHGSDEVASNVIIVPASIAVEHDENEEVTTQLSDIESATVPITKVAEPEEEFWSSLLSDTHDATQQEKVLQKSTDPEFRSDIDSVTDVSRAEVDVVTEIYPQADENTEIIEKLSRSDLQLGEDAETSTDIQEDESSVTTISAIVEDEITSEPEVKTHIHSHDHVNDESDVVVTDQPDDTLSVAADDAESETEVPIEENEIVDKMSKTMLQRQHLKIAQPSEITTVGEEEDNEIIATEAPVDTSDVTEYIMQTLLKNTDDESDAESFVTTEKSESSAEAVTNSFRQFSLDLDTPTEIPDEKIDDEKSEYWINMAKDADFNEESIDSETVEAITARNLDEEVIITTSRDEETVNEFKNEIIEVEDNTTEETTTMDDNNEPIEVNAVKDTTDEPILDTIPTISKFRSEVIDVNEDEDAAITEATTNVVLNEVVEVTDRTDQEVVLKVTIEEEVFNDENTETETVTENEDEEINEIRGTMENIESPASIEDMKIAGIIEEETDVPLVEEIVPEIEDSSNFVHDLPTEAEITGLAEHPANSRISIQMAHLARKYGLRPLTIRRKNVDVEQRKLLRSQRMNRLRFIRMYKRPVFT